MSKDLLLEIGTEEIPARFMLSTFDRLERLAQDKLTDNRIETGTIKVTGTPRRLVLYIEDVAVNQADLKKEVRGPAKNIAFDDEGNPTKAGAGFAKGQGLTPDQLEIRDTDNGEYVFASTTEEGQETIKLLPQLLTEVITELNFSKPMRWANQEMRFIRPIKWLLALYGTEKIDFSVAEVETDNWSLGHRFLSEGQIEISQPADYFSALEEEYVIVDHNQRREMIVEQIKKIEEEKAVNVVIDDDLLTEVNFLVEYPTALCGSFDQEFLELPSEVLITSMREHQRYFPVENDAKELENLFVTVRNGTAEHIDTVRHGNEKVLQARLSDAKFFYEEDQVKSLESKVKKLKDIIFQEDLGTIYDKVERIIALADKFAQELDLSNIKIDQATRAAKLAKADLVTEMVNEFSKLQGVMGREYALLDGEDQEVATAIFEHYLPRYAADILPESKVGQVVSIADKIDNIVACFSVGIIPTGSQDPYALRRQAQGIVNIIVDAKLDITLDTLIDSSLELLDDEIQRPEAKVKEDVVDFFKLRLEKLLEEADIRYDVRDAILATDCSDIHDTLIRAKAVMEFRAKDEFDDLIAVFNRVNNLAQKASEESIVNEELFESDTEVKLYADYKELDDKVDQLLSDQDYVTALEELTTIKESVDAVFDSVRVMAEDEAVRENRLYLLKLVAELLSEVADLDKIVID
ncbi:glycyl-tRNA synthetase, tetrameric type, beta subunit [Halobacteroides halobius DSM 5150]|uniref:Glycine--tRNA ligase beta subunit n=1 Tax=Halobacteroides halobius (strain ATCC 35273 / DSM 5150 / MD-1) TaxID=748449 RepID=L0K947_HALHC|nr:glycine--tRNA ligase subunit beta [Halobacteroides halobius]AGB41787.1 glycyl-tRNA synthetase, tetrameric type, beta subunit [Halobacteroides halobius DSM 5150]